jgi:GntR family transcriptional regulator
MTRRIRYREIADDLQRRVARGEFAPGDLLPSEAMLSQEYRVSRVTVRRALERLRDAGLVDARQGLGWFVAVTPLRQSLARLSTIESQLAAAGIDTERKVLDFAYVATPARLRRTLAGDQVLRVTRLNLADGRPFAVVTVWCPADLGAHVSRADVERATFYELLGLPLGGATQSIAADAAGPREAALLAVPDGSPVLRCERVTRDATGRVVLVSEHVFPGYRTEFVVELPDPDQSIAPSGLRLVE